MSETNPDMLTPRTVTRTAPCMTCGRTFSASAQVSLDALLDTEALNSAKALLVREARARAGNCAHPHHGDTT